MIYRLVVIDEKKMKYVQYGQHNTTPFFMPIEHTNGEWAASSVTHDNIDTALRDLAIIQRSNYSDVFIEFAAHKGDPYSKMAPVDAMAPLINGMADV